MASMIIGSQMSEKGQLKPVEELSFKSLTLLDAVFMSKAKKKPTWATTTIGSKTTIWRVSRIGHLEEIAAIRWNSVPDSSLHSSSSSINGAQKVVLVEINGELYPAEKFGKRSGGITNPTLVFAFKVDDMECKWCLNNTLQMVQNWKCTAEVCLFKVTKKSPKSRPLDLSRPVTAPISTVPPLESAHTHSRFKTLFSPFRKTSSKPRTESITLAEYYQTWNVRRTATISLYQAGVPYTFYLLISLILSNTKKDEWKNVQSSNTPEELQATLNADLTGNLPMYTPVRTVPDPKAKVKGDKRPRTANLHPTVSATDPWRWNTNGNDHDRAGNPLNVGQEGLQTISAHNSHYITQ